VKKAITIAAVASILLVGAAYAGSLSDPIVAPEVVMADAVQSASHVDTLLAAVTVIAIILGAAGAF